MICGRCGRPVIGWIEDHICEGERVGKVKENAIWEFEAFLRFSSTTCSKILPYIDQLEKENEELRGTLSKCMEAMSGYAIKQIIAESGYWQPKEQS